MEKWTITGPHGQKAVVSVKGSGHRMEHMRKHMAHFNMQESRHINRAPSEHLRGGGKPEHLNLGGKVHHTSGFTATVPQLGKRVFNY